MLRSQKKMDGLPLLAAGLVIALIGCSESEPLEPVAAQRELVVYTVNYPLAYFAERIGGDEIDVKFPAPADEDPAYWQPDASMIQAYQGADLILLNGAGYAHWTEMATLAPSKLINTSASFSARYVELQEAVTHAHGPEGEHEHTGKAFTTWLDLTLAVEQVRAVKEALVRVRPEAEASFEDGFAALETDLLELDGRIKEFIEGREAKPLIVSHPVYQYWTQGYGLNVQCVHWEPDENPTEAMWAELARLRDAHPAQWMIWESEPDDQIVERLQALGVESVVFAPCGNVPDKGDFLSVMKQNVDALSRVFDESRG